MIHKQTPLAHYTISYIVPMIAPKQTSWKAKMTTPFLLKLYQTVNFDGRIDNQLAAWIVT